LFSRISSCHLAGLRSSEIERLDSNYFELVTELDAEKWFAIKGAKKRKHATKRQLLKAA